MTPDEAREFFRTGDLKDNSKHEEASTVLKKEFARMEGAKESHARGDPILWLLGKRTGDVPSHRRWYDHGTRWTKDGKPLCLVGQPYGIVTDDVVELAELREQGLETLIDVGPSWHFTGRVLTVRVFVPRTLRSAEP